MRQMLNLNNKLYVIYFILAIIILTILGFLGYYFGFLKFIYNVMIPGTFSQYNIAILSIIFGFASFFSPCAFSILPSYVANYLGKEEKELAYRKSIYLGSIAALGIITVNMILGLVIALLGAATPFAKDPRQDIPLILGIRTVAGLLIVFLGLSMLIGRQLNMHFIQRLFSRFNLGRNMYTYGMLYNAAAIGCTGPILLGLMLYAYSSGSFTKAIIAFAIFSLTMAILMIVLTVIIAIFKKRLISKLVNVTSWTRKLAAIVMIVVGLFIVVLTLEGNNIFVNIFFPYLK